MTQYAPKCRERNHYDQHTDPAACDAYEIESRAADQAEILTALAERRQEGKSIRAELDENRKALVRQVREAVEAGVPVGAIAAASGMTYRQVANIKTRSASH